MDRFWCLLCSRYNRAACGSGTAWQERWERARQPPPARGSTDPRFMKNQTSARRQPLHKARRLPPALAPAQALAFSPLHNIALENHSGLCQLFWALCFLASSRGMNILFSFAFLTVCCLPQASHKLSNTSESGFSSLRALPRRLQPRLCRYSRFFCKQSSRHPTSLLFRSTEKAKRLKIQLSDE